MAKTLQATVDALELTFVLQNGQIGLKQNKTNKKGIQIGHSKFKRLNSSLFRPKLPDSLTTRSWSHLMELPVFRLGI